MTRMISWMTGVALVCMVGGCSYHGSAPAPGGSMMTVTTTSFPVLAPTDDLGAGLVIDKTEPHILIATHDVSGHRLPFSLYLTSLNDVATGLGTDHVKGRTQTSNDFPFKLEEGAVYVQGQSGTRPGAQSANGTAVGEGTVFVIEITSTVHRFYFLEGDELTVRSIADPTQSVVFEDDWFNSDINKFVEIDAAGDISAMKKLSDHSAQQTFITELIEDAVTGGVRKP